MALTKISRGLLNTGVSDSSDATAITIDSSEKVGLNGLSAGDYWSTSNQLVLGNTASGSNGGMTIATATNAVGQIYFADGTSGDARYRGQIQYNHISDAMDFATAASFRMRIDSSGNVGIGTDSPSSKLHVKVGTNNNFEIEETGGDLRLLAINDARNSNVPMEFAASQFDFLTGNVTKPSNCSFSARHGSTVSNYNINGYYQIPFDSEIYDNGGNLASSGTFTAPVTGRYLLLATVRFGTVDASATYSRIVIATSNRNYQGTLLDHSVLFSGDADYHVYFAHFIADMDANDTANVNYYQLNGAAQADLAGDESFFAGELLG